MLRYALHFLLDGGFCFYAFSSVTQVLNLDVVEVAHVLEEQVTVFELFHADLARKRRRFPAV